MSEPEAASTEHQPDEDAGLERARTVAEHLRTIRLVRTELLVNGGPITNDLAFRLLGPERFMHAELETLGHLALLEETDQDDSLPGRKSLQI